MLSSMCLAPTATAGVVVPMAAPLRLCRVATLHRRADCTAASSTARGLNLPRRIATVGWRRLQPLPRDVSLQRFVLGPQARDGSGRHGAGGSALRGAMGSDSWRSVNKCSNSTCATRTLGA
jgi:hypothetical protein